MKKTNIFDDVMNYIDENIKCKYTDVKKGIYANFAYTDMDFNKFLSIATRGSITLNRYFIRRKLYYVSKELIEKPTIPIVDIAYNFNYSEQSSLNRDMKKHYSITPNEVRKNRKSFPDEKMHFKDFDVNKCEWGKRLKDAIYMVTEANACIISDFDYFEQFIEATNNYGFDFNTCCAISEVSERLRVPFGYLLNSCFDLMIEYHSSDDYIDPRIEKAIDCGITSNDELEKICDYFECEYYELNPFIVESYRKMLSKELLAQHKQWRD